MTLAGCVIAIYAAFVIVIIDYAGKSVMIAINFKLYLLSWKM